MWYVGPSRGVTFNRAVSPRDGQRSRGSLLLLGNRARFLFFLLLSALEDFVIL